MADPAAEINDLALEEEDAPPDDPDDDPEEEEDEEEDDDDDNAVPFALTPAAVNPDVIDYSTNAGLKLYNTVTAPLEDKFDGTQNTLHGFLGQVKDRARDAIWSEILRIPSGGTKSYNLVSHYGQLTLHRVRQHASTYIGTPTRNAQNSAQLYAFLRNSIDKGTRDKVLLREDEYKIRGMPDGPCFLKVLILESHTDNIATVAHIRRNLTKLDTTIVTMGSNIDEFNHYVKQQKAMLMARGEESNDLVVNLFKAYEATSDREFSHYMRRKRDDYYEGRVMNPEQLMELAMKKYQELKASEEWNAETPEQKTILALKTEIEKMKKKTGKGNRTNPGKANGNNDALWAWKKVAPKNGQPKSKKVKEKMYHWCPKHKAWCLHKPSECKKGRETNASPPSNASTATSGSTITSTSTPAAQPSITLNSNLANVTELGTFDE